MKTKKTCSSCSHWSKWKEFPEFGTCQMVIDVAMFMPLTSSTEELKTDRMVSCGVNTGKDFLCCQFTLVKK